MENVPSNNQGKKYINQIIEKVVVKGTAIVYNKMQTTETRFISQTKNFVTYTVYKAARALKKTMATQRQVFSKIMATLKSINMLDKEDSSGDKE